MTMKKICVDMMMMKKNPALLVLLLLGSTHAGYLSAHQQLLVGSSNNVGTSATTTTTLNSSTMSKPIERREGLQYNNQSPENSRGGGGGGGSGYAYEKHRGNIVGGRGAGMTDFTLVNNIEELAREWRALNAEKNNAPAAFTAPYNAVRQQQQQQPAAAAPPKDGLNHKKAIEEMENLAREWAALNREHDSISYSSTMSTTTYKPQQRLWSTPVTPGATIESTTTPSKIMSPPNTNIAPAVVPNNNSKQHVIGTPPTMQELAQQWTAMNRDHDNRNNRRYPTRPVIPVSSVSAPASTATTTSTTTTTTTPRPLTAADLAREWAARNNERHDQQQLGYRSSSRAVVGGVVDDWSSSSSSSWSSSHSRGRSSSHSTPPSRRVDATATSAFKKKTAFPPVDVASLAREWASVNRDHNTDKQFIMPTPEDILSAASSSSTTLPSSHKSDTVPSTKSEDVSVPSPTNDIKSPPVPPRKDTVISQSSAVSRAKKVEVWAAKTIQEISADSSAVAKDDVTQKRKLERDFQQLAALARELQKVDEEIQMIRKMAKSSTSDPPSMMMQPPALVDAPPQDDVQIDNHNNNIVGAAAAAPEEEEDVVSFVTLPTIQNMDTKEEIPLVEQQQQQQQQQHYVGMTDPPADSSNDLPDWVLASLDFDEDENIDDKTAPTNGIIAPPPPLALNSKKTLRNNDPITITTMTTAAADSTIIADRPVNKNTNVPDWVLASSAPQFPANNNVPPEEEEGNVSPGVNHESPMASDVQPSAPTTAINYALPEWLLASSADLNKINDDITLSSSSSSEAASSFAVSPALNRKYSSSSPTTTTASRGGGGGGGSSSFAPSWVTDSQSSFFKDKDSPAVYGWTSPAPLAKDVIKSLPPPVAADPVKITTSDSSNANMVTSTKTYPKALNDFVLSDTHSPVLSQAMKNRETPPAAGRLTVAPRSTSSSGNQPAWVTAGASSPNANAPRSTSSSGNVPAWVTSGSSSSMTYSEEPVLEGWTMPTTPWDNASGMIASLNNAVLNSNDNDEEEFATLSFASPAKAFSRPIDVASPVFASPPKARVSPKVITGFSTPESATSTSSAVPSWVTAINTDNYVDLSLVSVETDTKPDTTSALTAVEAVTSALTSQAAKEWAAKNRNEKHGNAQVAALIQELEELDEEMRMWKGKNAPPIQPLVLTTQPRRDVTALEAISSASAARNSREWAAVNRRDPVVGVLPVKTYNIRDVTALEAISSASTAKSSREWAERNHRDPVSASVVVSVVLPRDVTSAEAVSFATAAKLAREWAKRNLNMKSKMNSATSRPASASSTSAPKSGVPPSRTVTPPMKTKIARPAYATPRRASSSKGTAYTSLTAKAFRAWAASRYGTSIDEISVPTPDHPKPRDVTVAEAISFASAAKNSRAWAHLNRKDPASATMGTSPEPAAMDPKPTAETGSSFSAAAEFTSDCASGEWTSWNRNWDNKPSTSYHEDSFADDDSISAFFFELSDEFKQRVSATVAESTKTFKADETSMTDSIAKTPVLFKAAPVTEMKTAMKLESVATIAKKMEKYMLEPPKVRALPRNNGASYPTNILKDKQEMKRAIMAGGIASMFAATIAAETLFERTVPAMLTRTEMAFATTPLEVYVRSREEMSSEKKEKSITNPSASSFSGEFTNRGIFLPQLLGGRFNTEGITDMKAQRSLTRDKKVTKSVFVTQSVLPKADKVEEKAFVPRLLHDDTLWD